MCNREHISGIFVEGTKEAWGKNGRYDCMSYCMSYWRGGIYSRLNICALYFATTCRFVDKYRFDNFKETGN